MQLQFVSHVQFSMPLAITELSDPFGKQAIVRLFVSFPSRRVLTWGHTISRSGNKKAIIPGGQFGILNAQLTRFILSNAHNLIDPQKTAEVADAFMEIFFDFPVFVYGSQSIVQRVSRPVFDKLMSDAVIRYNRLKRY